MVLFGCVCVHCISNWINFNATMLQRYDTQVYFEVYSIRLCLCLNREHLCTPNDFDCVWNECASFRSVLSKMMCAQNSKLTYFTQWEFFAIKPCGSVRFEHSNCMARSYRSAALTRSVSQSVSVLFYQFRERLNKPLKWKPTETWPSDKMMSDTAANAIPFPSTLQMEFIEYLHRQIIVNFPFAPIRIVINFDFATQFGMEVCSCVCVRVKAIWKCDGNWNRRIEFISIINYSKSCERS